MIQVLAKNIKIPEALAASTYDLGRTAMTPDGRLNEEAQRRAADMVIKTLGVNEPPPSSRLFDFSLATKIYKELRAARLEAGKTCARGEVSNPQ
jgi:hypothetical protein